MAPPQPIADDLNISRVSVKPPPFWKVNPTLWFAQLEAQFDIAGITVDSTKFNHVISAIESDILNSVCDIVLHPPVTGKYDTLKTRLIELHSESEESKIRTLLQGLELGHQRPSQLLCRMRNLAGETIGGPLLKSLWISRLPQNTQSILAALSDDLPKLAVVADKITDLTTLPHINSAATASTSPIEQQVAKLTKQVNELSLALKNSRERSYERRDYSKRNSRRNRSSGRYRQYKELCNNICFYHTNFGSKARKCVSPCNFRQSEN
ncbi:uncharacterized protein LOC118200760 [Stegodyphus dumicola]|uniref:uncharacterized protein LOC118200760 n=1 Tax=Stegodyphus dumicola TaxID=202533 RepID=UPI0015A762FA|nr:uncharacterized protein LOC118200760 [Stegodyphus dumicola]